MTTFEQFELDLQDALNHLYDPNHKPSTALLVGLGLPGVSAQGEVQALLIRCIEQTKPNEAVPLSARSWRMYELLRYRYIQRMTQQETAEHLAITDRHLRREQLQAVHALATQLWQQPRLPTEGAFQPDWQTQVEQELTALQRGESVGPAQVQQTIHSVLELVTPLSERHAIQLRAGDQEPNLIPAIRPAELRQILVQILSELARSAQPGDVTVSSRRNQKQLQILIHGPGFLLTPNFAADTLIANLVERNRGRLALESSVNQFEVAIFLPIIDRLLVLVVDDNPDLVHFYRRFTQDTRYEISWLASGGKIFEVVESLKPAMIVLDAMLPDVDGWELLSHLHAHPNTAHIPVVLCSVVREEELALVLGADVYLPKPVHRQQFLDALDKASLRLK